MMPYSTITDLPQDIQDKYSIGAQKAFLSTFNAFMADCTLSADKCEEGAFKRAYSAANRIRDSQKSDNSTLLSIPFWDMATIKYIQNALRSEYPNGEYIEPGDYHISLVYFPNGKTDVKPKMIEPFYIETSHYEIWETPDGYAYVMRFNDENLYNLQRLNTEGLNPDDYSEYHKPENFKPHLTLAYFDDEPDLLDLPSVKLHVDFVILERWGEILESTKMMTLDNESKSLLRKFIDLVTGQKSINVLSGESGFKSLGSDKWIAWYTNAYLDRHEEIIATKAIEEDTQYQNESGNYPDLRFFHIEGTEHGKALWSGTIGRYGVAIGEYFTDETSQKFKSWAESNPVKLSHGFYYLPEYKQDNTYNKIRTFEISVLPDGKEANPYTIFDIQKDSKMALTDEQLKALKEIVGDDVANGIIQKAESATKSNDEKLVYKADMYPEDETKEDMQTPQDRTDESQGDKIANIERMLSELMNMISGKMEPEEKAEEMPEDKEEEIKQLKAQIAQLQEKKEQANHDEFVISLGEIFKDYAKEYAPTAQYHSDVEAGFKAMFPNGQKDN